jgi:hypothetical protein
LKKRTKKPWPHWVPEAEAHTLKSKSFLLLFFKKEALSSA